MEKRLKKKINWVIGGLRGNYIAEDSDIEIKEKIFEGDSLRAIKLHFPELESGMWISFDCSFDPGDSLYIYYAKTVLKFLTPGQLGTMARFWT